eukprot:scpid110387/ scgid3486/ 
MEAIRHKDNSAPALPSFPVAPPRLEDHGFFHVLQVFGKARLFVRQSENCLFGKARLFVGQSENCFIVVPDRCLFSQGVTRSKITVNRREQLQLFNMTARSSFKRVSIDEKKASRTRDERDKCGSGKRPPIGTKKREPSSAALLTRDR